MTNAILREVEVDGERAIYLGPAVLVKSKTDPIGWHVVENGRCDCPAFSGVPGTDFAGRGTCRHIGVARQVEEMDRTGAVLSDAYLWTCGDCGHQEIGLAYFPPTGWRERNPRSWSMVCPGCDEAAAFAAL